MGYYADFFKNPALRAIHGCLDNLTPVNAVQATGTLTISGVGVDGETITIGTDIYELDTDDSYTAGNIQVDISGGATASDVVTALVAAITASGDGTYSGADGAGDTVDITFGTYGTTGNSTATTETMTNGAWGAATLENGVNGTPGKKGQMYQDDSYLYCCITKDTGVTNHYWKRVAISTF